MDRKQRFKYEMFVRVRDYGTTQHALFDHLKNRVVARAQARKVKTATRAAVFTSMKTLALVARRVTRSEPGTSPFRMPRRRSLAVELSAARAF